ncbi:MAG: NAD(P)/FAD-dependent oxidoreductase [Bacteriovoracaceae bacterium]|nr:NAD(P)/FAD-dependent oxidoreductase [Bacteriovoracaceae bacterium]
MSKDTKVIVIIGGGASGFFAAIEAASTLKSQGIEGEVHIFESAPRFLNKVKISGGGRCNVTHNQFDTTLFCQNYPRGKHELRSPFTKFQALDTVEWFKKRNVKLVAEEDGRMFPSTNKSDTIIECFMTQAQSLNVELHPRCGVQKITKQDGLFHLEIKNYKPISAHKVLIATGSSKAGYTLASSLGHKITELAPSLFSFKIKDALFRDLSGVSFQNAILSLKADGKKFTQQGPTLITHHGLSGPAVLKLSAWAAREMKRDNYKARLLVNWSGIDSLVEITKAYDLLKNKNLNTLIKNASPTFFTKRFWHNFLDYVGIEQDRKWSELSKKSFNKLIEYTKATPLDIQGQNRFKDEFVECGGVKGKEIDFKSMQSKICEGLFFSGEILDIDGITGGFNFQNAWTTGYIAGQSMAMDTLS